MKGTLLVRIVAFCVLSVALVVLTACVRVVVDQPSKQVTEAGMHVHVVLTNGGSETAKVPRELTRFDFDREIFFLQWPMSKWQTEDELELTIAGSSSNGMVLLYPMKLNGEEPPAQKGLHAVGIVSYNKIHLGSSDGSQGLEPVAVCPATSPDGPSIYIFQLYPEEIQEVEKSLGNTGSATPTSQTM